MHAYRFRMLYDDQEDFLRDFDILANQTFIDFHNIIKTSVELSGNELASFFVCDRNWRKKKEITLLNMQDDAQSDDDDEDDDRRSPKPVRIPIVEMEKVRIKDIIDDPHQRLLYEYDFLNPKIFFIELTKILDADKSLEYPICVKSTGKLVSVKTPMPPSDLDEEEDVAQLGEFDDILDNDDEFSDSDFSPDIDFI